MKNFILAVLSLMLPALVLSANNIKMVTYFPVPYASYSNLGVAGTCDVGLLNTCSLDSGPSLKVSKKGSLLHALNSGAITVNSGTLSLDSSATEGKVSGSGLTAGTSMGASGSGSLEFAHNLTVNTMPGTIQSAEATNEAVMKSLTLFGQTFPGCDAANNKISWRNLTLNGENGVYLVCGAGEKVQATCADRSYKLANKSICCPSASYSDTDCWIYKEASCVFEEDVGMGSFYGAGKSFELKDLNGSCYDRFNVVLYGSYSQTVGPDGRTCPEGAAPGTSCKGIVADGNYCAYIEDLGSLTGTVDCWQNGSMCTCSYDRAPALWCSCESGGYVANNW